MTSTSKPFLPLIIGMIVLSLSACLGSQSGTLSEEFVATLSSTLVPTPGATETSTIMPQPIEIVTPEPSRQPTSTEAATLDQLDYFNEAKRPLITVIMKKR